MGDVKDVIAKVCPKMYADESGKPKTVSSYKLTSQSDTAQLEPIYYWLLDFLQDMGIQVEKITDNFTSSPGSGHFSEMGQKATKMQEEGMKILGAINQVVKSALNLVYDLKEFEIRLQHYEKAKSTDKSEMESGMLALKNIWLDNVDLKRGRGSVHQMAAEMGFTTLREAFLVANTQKDLESMAAPNVGTINDSVKRILIPRLSEFLIWKDISEKELIKRFEIEKSYLRSQVETLKLYTRWARPYLKAAEELRMKGFDKNPALVGAFSTSLFELTLMGKKEIKKPKGFEDYTMKRKYYAIQVISMKYRGHLSQRVTQKGDYGFGYGGRIDMAFDSYTLNSDELKLVEKELEKDDIAEGLKFLEENTEISLKQLEEDIEHFLGDKKKEEKKSEKKEEKKEDSNPFGALFSIFKLGSLFAKKEEVKKEIKEPKDIEKDNSVEEVIRKEGQKSAKETLFTVYDVYKKAHGMASTPANLDN